MQRKKNKWNQNKTNIKSNKNLKIKINENGEK